MRMGLGSSWKKPNNAAGYTLISVGAIILLLAMPLYVYLAVIGGLISYVGYTLRGKQ